MTTPRNTPDEGASDLPSPGQIPEDVLRHVERGERALVKDVMQSGSPDTADRARWKTGALTFSACREAMLEGHEATTLRPQSLAALQAMSLGEKPAIADAVDLLRQADILARFGIRREGSYLYRSDVVGQVIGAHPEHFAAADGSSPEAVMAWLARQNPEQAAVPRGLVLGLPLKAVLDYRRMVPAVTVWKRLIGTKDQPGILPVESVEYAECRRMLVSAGSRRGSREEARDFIVRQCAAHGALLGVTPEELPSVLESVDTYMQCIDVEAPGINWLELPPVSDESRKKQNRLEAAFSLSQISAIESPSSGLPRKKEATRPHPDLDSAAPPAVPPVA